MKKIIFILAIVLLASCAVNYQTSVDSFSTIELTEKDHNSYLVRVYEQDPEIYKNMEILIVNLLRANNKKALPYHKVFPPINEYTKSNIEKTLKENNIKTFVGVFRDGHKINLKNFNLIRTKPPKPEIKEYINYKSHIKEMELNAPNGILNTIQVIDLQNKKNLYKCDAYTDFSGYRRNVKMRYTLSLVNTLAEDLRAKGFVSEIPEVVRTGYL